MKATELRIGNWVQIDDLPNEQVTLELFATLAQVPGTISKFYGIRLTEEWLEKFGLCENNEYHHYLTFTGKKIHYCVNSFNDEWIEIKYVHQLQNLYHSLTGEELKVKELV